MISGDFIQFQNMIKNTHKPNGIVGNVKAIGHDLKRYKFNNVKESSIGYESLYKAINQTHYEDEASSSLIENK